MRWNLVFPLHLIVKGSDQGVKGYSPGVDYTLSRAKPVGWFVSTPWVLPSKV